MYKLVLNCTSLVGLMKKKKSGLVTFKQLFYVSLYKLFLIFSTCFLTSLVICTLNFETLKSTQYL
ncbi:hypothetical protein BpHYR1_033076 [Brachionus plicatilis]|uniref:Uncharacterized protein n=1 Tax=Brachionus plicatilis TaxID=10195 RepID=A0A3M7RIQ6_BRAPC|nr:hypothetical protein BpHYR1_033076 [Brachionus plicatilis]